MATTTKPETLDQRRARLQGECNHLTCDARDALEEKLIAADTAEKAAATADDGPAWQAARRAKADLIQEREELVASIEAKQLALKECEWQIAKRDRDAGIREVQAHAKTAADVAPEIVEAVETLADALQRFAGQCAGVYRAGAAVDHDNERGLRELTSKERVWRDVEYHLRAALGLSTGAFIHGTALDQASELTTYAETLR